MFLCRSVLKLYWLVSTGGREYRGRGDVSCPFYVSISTNLINFGMWLEIFFLKTKYV